MKYIVRGTMPISGYVEWECEVNLPDDNVYDEDYTIEDAALEEIDLSMLEMEEASWQSDPSSIEIDDMEKIEESASVE